MNYYLPFTYAWASRSKTILEKISFFLIFIIPNLFASYFFGGGLNFEQFIICFITAMITFYSFYEIFYIVNDVYTVKHELTPTYRFSIEKHILLEQKAPILIGIRFLFTIMGIILLIYLNNTLNLMFFLLILFLIFISYSVHNFYRSRITIISYLFLTTLRYIAVPMLFMKHEYIITGFVTLFFSFSLLRAIEYAGTPKFELFYSKILNKDKFRVLYYILNLIFAIFLVLFVDKAFVGMLILGMWFLLFRLATFFILSIDKVKKQYRQ